MSENNKASCPDCGYYKQYISGAGAFLNMSIVIFQSKK